MRTGSIAAAALSRKRPHVLRFKQDPRSRVIRTFVFTFTTWALFLCYLLAFAA